MTYLLSLEKVDNIMLKNTALEKFEPICHEIPNDCPVFDVSIVQG